MNLIKKIWNDSVWSKVIAGVILAGIPISVFWQIVKNAMSSVSLFLLKNWSYSVNVLLFIILLILGFIYFSKRNSKNALKWLHKINKTQIEKCIFLFWFPINGTLVGDYAGLPINIIRNINNTKIVDDLLRNDVINIDRRFLARMTINRTAYEYLENVLTKNADLTENAKEVKEALRGKEFKEVVYNTIYLQKEMA